MSRFGVLAVAVGAVVLAGCSAETPGQALPAGTTTSASTESSTQPRPTSTSAGAGGGLAGVDPCGLFTEEVKGRLGITTEGETNSSASSEGCQWRIRKDTIAESYSIGVLVFPKLGLDKVVAVGEKTPVQVGGRKGVQSLRAGGNVCAVSVEVTATSRVDVQITGGSAGAEAMCPKAMEAAELIEPELP